MSVDKQTLFLGLSWEERCYLGLKEDFKRFNNTTSVFLICNHGSLLDDNNNKGKIFKYCEDRNIDIISIELDYDNPIEMWKILNTKILEIDNLLRKPIIDISTMPREISWMLMYFIRRFNSRITFTYHSPLSYNDNWLSKEPGSPRLLLKHSGITYFNRQTAIILITGFDELRTMKLVEYYEPKLILLGIQSGSQYSNKKRNDFSTHSKLIKGQTEVRKFSIDAFSNDFGYTVINSEINKIEHKYNIIACSQGPKPTSIALYKSFLSHSDLALCYVPSGEFNRAYSEGIKNTYKFDVDY
jgi:hypothetical protein